MPPMEQHSEPVRLRDAREAAGLTQAELATQVGITKQSISDFEVGDKVPSLPTAAAIARVLGSTVDALFLGGESANVANNTPAEHRPSAAPTGGQGSFGRAADERSVDNSPEPVS